ncbi:hypothetical protein EAG_10568 [Camponotus floridanus]|uniref:Uncharacterized protein n=1 Tax=Camponotus floridanus TaxID=104421 RepID=E2AC39_CAMFO|nr:hypothetical protein EAG_10568 [Camponotus floridanus]
MNFYVPIRNGETPSCKKQKCDTIQPCRAARILGRRYALTPTSYKYLDIGISVGAVSYVELILGDNRGNQIVLSFSRWNLLMRKQADVEQFLQSTAYPLRIGDLTIDISSNCRRAALPSLTIFVTPAAPPISDPNAPSDKKLSRFATERARLSSSSS